MDALALQDAAAPACQVTTFEALQAALLHPAISSDVKQLCSMAATCRSWREAIQASTCGTADIFLHHYGLKKMANFTLWLPRYAGVVSSINLHFPYQVSDGEHDDGMQAAMEALLLLSLQHAAMPGRKVAGLITAAGSGAEVAPYEATAAAAAAAAAAAPCLRLKSFSSSPLHEPAAMISALPAATLTSLILQIQIEASQASDSASTSTQRRVAGIGAVLPLLTNLCALNMYAYSTTIMGPCVPAACLAPLSSLQQLSSLAVNLFRAADAALLPLQLQHLTIKLKLLDRSEILELLAAEAAPGSEVESLSELLQLQQLDPSNAAIPPAITGRLDLAHLANLRHLCLFPDGHLLKGSCLPSQLRSLTIVSYSFEWFAALNISSLQQLQLLQISANCENSELLVPIGQLPSLQQLHLDYCTLKGALAAAPAWKLLPQLQQLTVQHAPMIEPGVWDPEIVRRLLEGVGPATSLTQLELKVSKGGVWDVFRGAADVAGPQGGIAQPNAAELVEGCRYLTGLSNLKHLALQVGLKHGDGLHLSKLTALTYLALWRCGEGVGDTTAVAIACSCRKLQYLNLYGCGLSSSAAFPAIGALLTDLRLLDVGANAACTESNIMMLTGLTKLTSLGYSTAWLPEEAQKRLEALRTQD